MQIENSLGKEVPNLFFPKDINYVCSQIKEGVLLWARCMRKGEFVENLEGKEYLGDLDIDES